MRLGSSSSHPKHTRKKWQPLFFILIHINYHMNRFSPSFPFFFLWSIALIGIYTQTFHDFVLVLLCIWTSRESKMSWEFACGMTDTITSRSHTFATRQRRTTIMQEKSATYPLVTLIAVFDFAQCYFLFSLFDIV